MKNDLTIIEKETIRINLTVAMQVNALLDKHGYNTDDDKTICLADALCEPEIEAQEHLNGETLFSAHDIYRLSRSFICPESYFFEAADEDIIDNAKLKERMLALGIRL